MISTDPLDEDEQKKQTWLTISGGIIATAFVGTLAAIVVHARLINKPLESKQSEVSKESNPANTNQDKQEEPKETLSPPNPIQTPPPDALPQNILKPVWHTKFPELMNDAGKETINNGEAFYWGGHLP